MSTLYLFRHPPVVEAWASRCYGQSDPGLSRVGQKMVAPLAAQLAELKPDILLHSDMTRTRIVANRTGLPNRAEPLWRERNFGSWEGQSWNRIYRETSDAMDDMIGAPDSFRPGGSETTREFLDRIRVAMYALPEQRRIAIITHGGPIACVRLIVGNKPMTKLPSLIPPTSSMTLFNI